MISKRILLAMLCFLVLFGAFGVYSYGEISSLKSQMGALQQQVSGLEDERDSLQGQIETLQEEIDHLQNEIAYMNSTRTFIFEWPPWEQNIVGGVLRIELIFAWLGENLSIVAKINDDESNPWDCLALAFDEDEADGIPDTGVNFYANGNLTWGFLTVNNRVEDPFMLPPVPSDFHTCVFEPGVGYTFNVLTPPFEPPTDSVFVRFEDVASHGVYIYFQFGLPLEDFK